MNDIIQTTGDFFAQAIKVKRWMDPSRRPGFFGQFIQGKRTLHVGCADYPFAFNPATNLHVQLYNYTQTLDGLDQNPQEFAKIAMHVPGMYFTNFDDIIGFKYDVCLVPETIEHVDNIQMFLSDLNKRVDANTFIITAPNCFATSAPQYNGETWLEMIHPDHKVWFSPYTLAHCIRTYVPEWNIREVWMIENDSMIAVVCDRNAP